MKYMKQFKDGSGAFEVTKEKARWSLEGNWKKDFLDDVFANGKSFRLFTSFAEIWTVSDDGLVPEAGFYGVCE